MDFVVPTDHWLKIKENEKIEKYSDLAVGLKKLRNMKGDGELYRNWSPKAKKVQVKLEIVGRIETIYK